MLELKFTGAAPPGITLSYDREEVYLAYLTQHLHDYDLITDPKEIGLVLDPISRASTVAVDLETTGLDYNRDSIHGISLALDDREWYLLGTAAKAALPGLKQVFSDPNLLVVGHNLGFDLHFLKRYGVVPAKFADTMIGQFYVDENQGLSLKHQANLRLGFRDKLPSFNDYRKDTKKLLKRRLIDDVTIYDIPLEPIAAYAALDARLTYDLWEVTQNQLKGEQVEDIFWDFAMPFLMVLLEMESNGFWIDRSAMAQVEKEFNQEADEALRTWKQLAGDVNPNSPKQLGELFYKDMGLTPSRYTATGQPSTDALALQRLSYEDSTGTVAALLKYRKYTKLIDTYINKFAQILYEGRLYGSFNQTGARTGRLSSSRPNLQNIPGRGEEGGQVRSLFAAPLGYSIVGIDYSQIELRLLAHYCGDENMLRVFEEGLDPHQMTADLLNIERRDAKAVNFGIPYGIGPVKLQDSIEKAGAPRPPVTDTKRWLNEYMVQYPRFAQWQAKVFRLGAQLGYVQTVLGRKRHLPDLSSPDHGIRSAAERQAPNAIIQGSAADVIGLAMLRISSELHGEYGAKMLAQVHDELVWEVPETYAEEFAGRASTIMEDIGKELDLNVKLIAEPGIGPSWAEAK